MRVEESKSGKVACEFGVPQGSMLGSILFTLYVAPVANVLTSYMVSVINKAEAKPHEAEAEAEATTHEAEAEAEARYADDTQLHVHRAEKTKIPLLSCRTMPMTSTIGSLKMDCRSIRISLKPYSLAPGRG